MVKNSIKIYARLKKEDPAKTAMYEVIETGAYSDVVFRIRNLPEFVNNRPLYHKFRFHKIFDQDTDQTGVFEAVAKPVVISALKGFNSTIFAYGQTGSGKTYAITGSSDDYHERGIIPRSIEEIFNFVDEAPDKYTICISYLEIYNEVGYDLLNPGQKFSSLEDLPKVVLLEDGKGDFYMRNLSTRQVSNEQEAMRLLFIGDTNRTIAETPMNVYSSRSHCIFTICITSRSVRSGKIRRSRLNLVDLAGSERVNKSKISGTTLNEAKHINLSLHYLEQVVLALSTSKRGHIPYRNSMLTYMLKDSLAGNCITILLATLAVNRKNLEETIATCKFAQRVAAVDMDAVINEEMDPHQEIEHLKREIVDLRTQLQKYTRYRAIGKLTPAETEACKKLIEDYLNDVKNETDMISSDVRHIQFCFRLLKQKVKDHENQRVRFKSVENSNNEQIDKYKKLIREKEEEISILTSLLNSGDSKLLNTPESSSEFERQNFSIASSKSSRFESLNSETSSLEAEEPQSSSKFDPPNVSADPSQICISSNQETAFETFIKNPDNTLELSFYKKSIEHMHEMARNLTTAVEQYQKHIVLIRSKLKSTNNACRTAGLNVELQKQQDLYKESLVKLQKIKAETENLKKNLEAAKVKLVQKFKELYSQIGDGYKFDIPKENFWTENAQKRNLRTNNRSNFNELKKECKPRTNCVLEQIGDTLDNVISSPKRNQCDYFNPMRELKFSPNSFPKPRLSKQSERIAQNGIGSGKMNQAMSERPYTTGNAERFQDYQKSPVCVQSKSQESILSGRSYDDKPWNLFNKTFINPDGHYGSTRKCSTSPAASERLGPGIQKEEFSEDIATNRKNNFQDELLNDLSANFGREGLSSGVSIKFSPNYRDEMDVSRNYRPNFQAEGPSKNVPITFNSVFLDGLPNRSSRNTVTNAQRTIRSVPPKRSPSPNRSETLNNEAQVGFREFAKPPVPGFRTNNLEGEMWGLEEQNYYGNAVSSGRRDYYHGEFKESSSSNRNCGYKAFRPEDPPEFRDFIAKVPLTGDDEVDEEIVKFYRTQMDCE